MSNIPQLSRYIYKLHVDGGKLTFSDGYRLYSALLENVPEEYGDFLHEEGNTPLSQFLSYDRGSDSFIWCISLLSDEANRIFSPVLSKEMALQLHPEKIKAVLSSYEAYEDAESFTRHVRSLAETQRFVGFRLETPVAFKQTGHYVIYPQERLILQSLIRKWDEVFPSYPLDDPDAFAMLENGIYIRDYTLRTTRFRMKGSSVPGCRGELYFQTHLPAPMTEIWNLLMSFSGFCGIGIKTTLGMGGVTLITGVVQNT